MLYCKVINFLDLSSRLTVKVPITNKVNIIPALLTSPRLSKQMAREKQCLPKQCGKSALYRYNKLLQQHQIR